MTTDTERCPQCDDNNRCGHGDTWEHHAATVIRALTAERDALKAREAKLREAAEQALTFHQVTHIHSVLRAATYEPVSAEDQ